MDGKGKGCNMPIKNFDDMAKALFEPIEFIVEGKTYTVSKVTAELISGLTQENTGNDVGVVCRQLAKIVGAKPDTFLNTDLRIVTAALQFVTEEATQQMNKAQPKNPILDEVKP